MNSSIHAHQQESITAIGTKREPLDCLYIRPKVIVIFDQTANNAEWLRQYDAVMIRGSMVEINDLREHRLIGDAATNKILCVFWGKSI